MIVGNPNFPSDSKAALRNGLLEAEVEFLR